MIEITESKYQSALSRDEQAHPQAVRLDARDFAQFKFALGVHCKYNGIEYVCTFIDKNNIVLARVGG